MKEKLSKNTGVGLWIQDLDSSYFGPLLAANLSHLFGGPTKWPNGLRHKTSFEAKGAVPGSNLLNIHLFSDANMIYISHPEGSVMLVIIYSDSESVSV